MTQITLPYLLQNGQVADATQVMADLNAIVAAFANFGPTSVNIKLVTAGAAYNVLITDSVVLVNKAVGSATAITLPALASYPALATGVAPVLYIKDKKGDAATNPITITAADSALIDGQTSAVLAFNHQSLTLVADPNGWNIL